MNNQNFTTSISVDQNPETVFNAVNNVRGWWSEDIEGQTDHLHAEFLYHYKDVHITRMKIVELHPGSKVVWHVLENHFNFISDQSEWKDNLIVFEIIEKDGKTVLTFTQEGLVPSNECYKVCRDAWTKYITGSLYNLITEGKGHPNPKGADGEINKEVNKKWGIQPVTY